MKSPWSERLGVLVLMQAYSPWQIAALGAFYWFFLDKSAETLVTPPITEFLSTQCTLPSPL